MTLKDNIAKDLDIPVRLIDKAIKEAYARIRHIKMVKRNGEFRYVQQPSRNLKVIQYWLINNIFVHLNLHSSAIAYRRSTSVKDNAFRHHRGTYFLKLDFKDFFPSITFKDLLPIISVWHENNMPEWLLNPEAIELIKRACFDKNERLPIGYPSSPIISNIVMFDFDSRLSEGLVSKKEEYGNVVYTRYADDIVFSTNKKASSGEIYKFVKKFIEQIQSPKFKINPQKTKFSSSSGGSAFLTGLRVCYDGHITIHRKYKDHVRLLLSLLKKGKLKGRECSSLKGHISYIRHVDPSFYNKLQGKYFQIIEVLFKT